MKPRIRNDYTELMEILRREAAEQDSQATGKPKRVRTEAYKKDRLEKKASLRAERLSLGLCSDCGGPKTGDQTRCADCMLRHQQYGARSEAKARIRKESG